MAKKAVITIDYSDWLEEWQASKVQPRTMNELVDAMQEMPIKPLEGGRLALTGREQGHADPEILSDNKVTLNLGAAVQVSRHIAAQKDYTDVKGHRYQVRKYVASADGEDDIGDERLLGWEDPEAKDRAERYLLHVVPGYIWGRMVPLAGEPERLRAVVETLVADIQQKLSDLV